MANNNTISSYVDKDGEWRTRKITLMGVVKSFVSQLRPGQDLTRVSLPAGMQQHRVHLCVTQSNCNFALPAVLLYPFSMLEVFGYRETTFFEQILNMNKEEDPLERMLCVIKWLLATIQQETFHKVRTTQLVAPPLSRSLRKHTNHVFVTQKPYNPVLGETHEVWTELKDWGRVDYLSEQVSHHPPISAFVVSNNHDEHQTSLTCNLSFGVKFGGNYASIVTEGTTLIKCEKYNEVYELPRRTPDMVVKNVVFGTKKIFWSGELTIMCPSTRYSATLTFKESGNENVVNGTVSVLDSNDTDELLFTIHGKASGVINITNVKTSEKKQLIDCQSKRPYIYVSIYS
jgi:hypothetical protein